MSALEIIIKKKSVFSKGRGSFLLSVNGKKYLDFVQGLLLTH